MGYLLDTNIFNQLVDGRISFSEIPNDAPLLATYLQFQEIGNTKRPERREVLQRKFQEVNPQTVPVETSLWGVTPYGQGKYGGGSELFKALLVALDSKNNGKKNNYADALIAEVTIVNSYTLITSDQYLADLVVSKSGKLKRFAA